uniref:Venom peptide Sh41 n=1 Tax=Isodontia harmandi TaxID=2838365 RepID=VP41_ISOHA|nr:RecName: Full=Venom peptide Sh41 [Isodontia harmandi]
DDLSDFNPKV